MTLTPRNTVALDTLIDLRAGKHPLTFIIPGFGARLDVVALVARLNRLKVDPQRLASIRSS
jgi:hypothetical protein